MSNLNFPSSSLVNSVLFCSSHHDHAEQIFTLPFKDCFPSLCPFQPEHHHLLAFSQRKIASLRRYIFMPVQGLSLLQQNELLDQ